MDLVVFFHDLGKKCLARQIGSLCDEIHVKPDEKCDGALHVTDSVNWKGDMHSKASLRCCFESFA
jgi:hypothetical protein